jgi:hypothetical protein
MRNLELFYPLAQALGHFASGLEIGSSQENCKFFPTIPRREIRCARGILSKGRRRRPRVA